MAAQLSRPELIDLMKQILDPVGLTEDAHDELIRRFESAVPRPGVTDLIYYWSDGHFDHEPSPEEIVDKALSYKPIAL